MKKVYASILCIICILAASCTDYQEQIDDIQEKIDNTKADFESIQTTAASLPTLLEAIEAEETVTGFIPIAQSDGTLAGFKIYFKNGTDCTLYNTSFALVPCIDNGIWYWKDGGQWITDSEGGRIEVINESTPLILKEDGDSVLYSCDGGVTWQEAAKKTEYLFQSVSEDAENIVLTLSDGTVITLAKETDTGFYLKLGTIPESITSGCMAVIPYSISEDAGQVHIRAIAPEGWSVSTVQNTATSGTICIGAPQTIYAAAVTIIADNGAGQAIATDIKFKKYLQAGDKDVTADPVEPEESEKDAVLETYFDTYEEASCSHTMVVSLKTNLSYTIEIEKDAQSWMTISGSTKTVRTDELHFNIENNSTTDERSGKITFKSGVYSTSIMVIQAGKYEEQSWQKLKFSTNSGDRHEITLSYSGDVATLQTTGTDPYISTNALTADLPDAAQILTFEYTSTKRIGNLQIFFRPPLSESNSTFEGALAASSAWKSVSFPINTERLKWGWGEKGDFLRMDFGSAADITIKVRNIHFRNATAEEQRKIESDESAYDTKTATSIHLQNYLKREFLSEVTEVEVKEKEIVVKGHANGLEGYYLAEIPAYEVAADMEEFEYKTPLDSRDFTITLDRYVEHQGITADRLLSSWAIVKSSGSEDVLASHARYADKFECKDSPAAPVYKTQKGLAGYWGHRLQTADLDSLNASSVTINIRLNYYMTSNTESEYYHDYCGKRYYFKYIDQLDKLVRECSNRGIVVSVIVLVQLTNSILQHPECTGGNYSMPNMTTQESINAYAAVLDYLADRYSRNDGQCGIIHKWIMHNEVDMSTSWTNMGQQPINRYMDAYHHSMRICHNIARCHNEYAEVMASFTNSWTNCQVYSPKEMLDILLQYSECEGDFKWGLAYHSYPQNLADPKVWNDSNATYSMNTSMISFKNLEVLDKWIKMPEHMYKHTEKRSLWLSENGANTPSYSDTDFKNQAACAAWALYKVSQLDGIDAITWHNWYDDTSEGTLRLGLRKKQKYDFEAKPAYYVYRAGMTDDWEEVFAPYLSVIGISDWPSIMHCF